MTRSFRFVDVPMHTAAWNRRRRASQRLTGTSTDAPRAPVDANFRIQAKRAHAREFRMAVSPYSNP